MLSYGSVCDQRFDLITFPPPVLAVIYVWDSESAVVLPEGFC